MTSDLAGAAILIVDDTPENLAVLTTIIQRGGMAPRPVSRGDLAIESAVSDPPDLVLLDINMPGMSGFEVCRWFKQDINLHSIPIIFISGMQGLEEKIEAFKAGGADFISKPFQGSEVVARVRTHLSLRRHHVELASHNHLLEERIREQVKNITASQSAIIFALAKLSEARDDDTGRHLERVKTYAVTLAAGLRARGFEPASLTPEFIDNLCETASLHDIGKVHIPDRILLKPGKLTADEFEEMKKHSRYGAETLAEVLARYPDNPILRMGVDVARAHHEKWDGSGYPDGLQEKEIPLAARIVALADYYDALTTNRCYRPAFDTGVAFRMILENQKTHFEPKIVETFCDLRFDFERIHGMMIDSEAFQTR